MYDTAAENQKAEFVTNHEVPGRASSCTISVGALADEVSRATLTDRKWNLKRGPAKIAEILKAATYVYVSMRLHIPVERG